MQALPAPTSLPAGYVGSASCRECHEEFYKLWAPSHHGLAMQPYTAEFARTQITAQKEDIRIGKRLYRAEIGGGTGFVREQSPEGEKTYQIDHVMGGKNVYYFLTPLARGRLQVLPVAYDVNKKAWYDTAASGVRHFPDRRDEAIDWKERPYTFNTSCYGCHVSQLATNYDLKTDSYQTVWGEPGINCETCHGPAGEHVRTFKQAPADRPPKELKIISTKELSPEQNDAICAPCHAKMIVVTTTFQPGDRYFDHYDLVTLEHPDFWPDGRDLGENYTYTLWRMSPCAKSGKLHCLHCHTSSGRYRFLGEQANHACAPCHEERVRNAPAHSHHAADSEANKCVSCHMPMTDFARMRRSDHSMRPPAPAATLAFKSPNACNACHADKDAAWADQWVRKWQTRDYQAPVLRDGSLIAAARANDWSRLREILEYVTSPDRDEIAANSLVRLLRACPDDSKWATLIKTVQDPSPLIRASAAEELGDRPTPEVVRDLLAAAGDEYRLVRIRAAASLARFAPGDLPDPDRRVLERAVAELEASMMARPDDAASHYNLGNFYMARQQPAQAAKSFETAVKLQPDLIMPWVNASLAYNALGRNAKAEESLRSALKLEPNNVAANLNLGLLLGEMGRGGEAESAFRATLKTEPNNAVAAYNLGVLVSGNRPDEAIQWCRKAAELRPDEPKYAYTVAFFLRERGDTDAAMGILQGMVRSPTPYADAYALLGEIYEKQGKTKEAVGIYNRALANDQLPEQVRYRFAARLRALSPQYIAP
jgi:tetratricopeptide (TPR) repeat protein